MTSSRIKRNRDRLRKCQRNNPKFLNSKHEANNKQLRKSESRVLKDRGRVQQAKVWSKFRIRTSRKWQKEFKRYTSKSRRQLSKDLVSYELEQMEIEKRIMIHERT